jgi:drug/metabolite transporter (DMT)-like permease
MNTNDERRQELRAEMERRRDRAFRAAPSWRTRARRRAIVALSVMLVAGAATAVHVELRNPALLVGALLGYFALAIVLRLLTRGIADSPDHQLDERDRAMRDHVWRRAYWAVGIALAALVLYATVTQDAPGFGPRMVGMLMVLAWVTVFAPTFVLAWVLPDDDPEDLT